jgi:C4-dicarboxylate-specific signal transduction histidine kinase
MDRARFLSVRRTPAAAWALALTLGVATVFLVWQAAYNTGVSRAERALDQRLQLLARAVESEVEKFRSLAPVLARDARVRWAISRSCSPKPNCTPTRTRRRRARR